MDKAIKKEKERIKELKRVIRDRKYPRQAWARAVMAREIVVNRYLSNRHMRRVANKHHRNLLTKYRRGTISDDELKQLGRPRENPAHA